MEHLVRIVRHTALLAAAILLAACGAPPTPEATSEAPKPTPTVTRTATPTPLPDRDGDGAPDVRDGAPDNAAWAESSPPPTVECAPNGDFSQAVDVVVIPGAPDFTAAWAVPAASCDFPWDTRITPTTDTERQAYAIASAAGGGYTDNDIVTLYNICASTDGNYASLALNRVQAAEVQGALTLCPAHPLAAAYRQAIARGAAEAEAVASGQMFGSGTFLVGTEIHPGPYVIEGDITDCYWERQDSAGQIIDNFFTMSARRVEVSIASTDYAFFSEGCGQWRRP